MAGEADGVTGRVGDLGVAEHVDRHLEAVEIEAVGPGFLRRGQAVDVAFEEKEVPRTVVPAPAGGEHVVVAPGVEVGHEGREGSLAVVEQVLRPDEDRIREHVDVVEERKELDAGVVGAVDALDDLAVLILHGAALLEDGDAVAGVEVEKAGAEKIAFLVGQLDDRTAELGEILVDQVVELVARQDGLVLEDLDMAEGLDIVAVEVPEGRIADEVGAVVEETRRAENLAVVLPALFDETGGLGAQEQHQRVLVPVVLLLREQREDGHKGQETGQEAFSDGTSHGGYFRNLSAHWGRVNSHSLNSGSMTM